MSTYTVVKFLHVVGGIGYFAATIVLLYTLVALRRANRAEQVRTLSGLTIGLTRLFFGSVLALLAAGLYMAFTTWGFLESYAAAPHAPGWLIFALFWLCYGVVTPFIRSTR